MTGVYDGEECREDTALFLGPPRASAPASGRYLSPLPREGFTSDRICRGGPVRG